MLYFPPLPSPGNAEAYTFVQIAFKEYYNVSRNCQAQIKEENGL